MRKYRDAGRGEESLKKTSSFLAAGACELEGVNQRLGAQRDTARKQRKTREMKEGKLEKEMSHNCIQNHLFNRFEPLAAIWRSLSE